MKCGSCDETIIKSQSMGTYVHLDTRDSRCRSESETIATPPMKRKRCKRCKAEVFMHFLDDGGLCESCLTQAELPIEEASE